MSEPRQILFTDEQVTSACDLHLDNLRRLITWGAVKPVQAGGGRGRVRKWTPRQALRISVTAQFVDAGYSLRMAHTLTYCLPLDYLLRAYEAVMPESARGIYATRLPTKEALGSETFIVDKKYLYSDVRGTRGVLFAEIDDVNQKVYPRFGLQELSEWELPDMFYTDDSQDLRNVSMKSLLIDEGESFEGRAHVSHPPGFPDPVASPDKIVCRDLLIVNLAIGLTIFTNRLLGIPFKYFPYETYEETADLNWNPDQ